MLANIHVIDNTAALMDVTNEEFAARVERLTRYIAREESPIVVLTRRTIGGAVEGLATAPDRDRRLRSLLAQKPWKVARETLTQLTDLLPPVRGKIVCYLLPNGGTRGSGNCFGADRLLATVPCTEDALPWLRFVIAHEYSHTHRGFGCFAPQTVRDHLVFEGLAMVLAEEFVPEVGRIFREEVSEEDVADFWATVDPEAPGLDGYMRYMGHKGAYEAGARIIRSCLENGGLSIGKAHGAGNDELFAHCSG